MKGRWGRSSDGRGPLPEHGVHLGEEAILRFRVLGKQVEGPGERAGGGLVPGQEEGHHLVAELPVGHPLAIPLLVSSREQHGQEVATVDAAPPPLRDQLVDGVVQTGHRAGESTIAGQGEELEQTREGKGETREEVEDGGQGLADLLGLALHFDPEEGLGHDGHGEGRHLLVEVDLLAGPPAIAAALRVVHHGLAIGSDALAVEGGLDEPPLPPVELTVGGEQPLAEERLGPLEPQSLLEGMLLRDQHLLHVVGVAHQVGVGQADPQAHDVAVFTRHPRHEGQRVSAQLEE